MSNNRVYHVRGIAHSFDETIRQLRIARHHLRMSWKYLKDLFDFIWRWIRNAPVTR